MNTYSISQLTLSTIIDLVDVDGSFAKNGKYAGLRAFFHQLRTSSRPLKAFRSILKRFALEQRA